jgi:hypothetical protein
LVLGRAQIVGGMVACAGMLSWLVAPGGIGGMVAGAVADANRVHVVAYYWSIIHYFVCNVLMSCIEVRLSGSGGHFEMDDARHGNGLWNGKLPKRDSE